jgi:hypothetical protein
MYFIFKLLAYQIANIFVEKMNSQTNEKKVMRYIIYLRTNVVWSKRTPKWTTVWNERSVSFVYILRHDGQKKNELISLPKLKYSA